MWLMNKPAFLATGLKAQHKAQQSGRETVRTRAGRGEWWPILRLTE